MLYGEGQPQRGFHTWNGILTDDATPSCEDPWRGARPYALRRFSDAVFAIALTLLIVEIKVPGSPQGPQGYTDLVHAMAEQWREHLALVLCYIVIGAYWLQHHYSGRI